MALVEHEVDARVGGQRPGGDDLVHDAEELEGIRGADDEVVVGVEARVEVEGAQAPQAHQLGDDELDVRARGMVPGVQDDLGALSERQAVDEARAPVRDIGVVEGRLEELVLQDELLILVQGRVDLGQGVGQAVLALPDGVLPRVVRAVCQPDLQGRRAGGPHDVDALQVVGDRLGADPFVGVAQGPQLVVLVLEDVGVDGPDGDALVLGVAAQGVVVVRPVPRDVQGDARRDAGEAVDLGDVVDLLVGVAGHARGGEDPETSAGVAEGPAGQLDGLGLQQAAGLGAQVGQGRGGGVGRGRHALLRSDAVVAELLWLLCLLWLSSDARAPGASEASEASGVSVLG